MRARSIELLSRVGIPDPDERVDHYAHQFSDGQKQRIIIAMALALNPRSSSPTSRPARSTCPSRRRCSTCSCSCSRSLGSPACSSRMTWP
ncbi:hypothetical protein BSZ39_10415 [Bowdeniella nasicola]|uniref:ABC transporter domain-containing protein n=1 Tax=Bowdeniella nasicola TaxID=208480 RepID=A0A1Q5Q0X2_9ACTO|nr:ATP-binding cassette domain-containing protein [Bowdeniella nasicola]OKL53260.1 hypothetical protein BSZ39_10415 [Bowdeniella nasicola]